ncbi:UbiD family decarboxylase domain-containing protein [Escherichia coli]
MAVLSRQSLRGFRDPLDPDNFGKQNVGIYRMEVKGKRKLGLQPVPMHDIALHLHKAEERGEICRLQSRSVTIRSSR